MKRRVAWLIAIPLMLAGTLVAHSLAYRLAYPQAEVRWRVLAVTGHGYLGYLPLLLGLIGAVALIGLVAAVVDSARGRGPRPLPASAFALLPLAAFTLQEFTERWIAGSNFPWWMVLQPTFRLGLLLQLPFALIAYLAARLLLRTARALGEAIRARLGVPLLRPVARVHVPFVSIDLPRPGVQRCGWGLRGPPLPLA